MSTRIDIVTRRFTRFAARVSCFPAATCVELPMCRQSVIPSRHRLSRSVSERAASLCLRLGAEELVGFAGKHREYPIRAIHLRGFGCTLESLKLLLSAFRTDERVLLPEQLSRPSGGRLLLSHVAGCTIGRIPRQRQLTFRFPIGKPSPPHIRVGRTRHDAGFLGGLSPEHQCARTFVAVRPRGKRAGVPHFRSETDVSGN